MLVGALTQVYGGQVKAKHFHRAHQWAQTLAGHGHTMVRGKRRVNRLQIGKQLFGLGVGVLRRYRMAGSVSPGERFERGGQTRVHTDQGTAIGLVTAVLTRVG